MVSKIRRLAWYVFVFFLPWQTALLLREVFFEGEKWQYGTVAVYFSETILLFWIFLNFWKKKKSIRLRKKTMLGRLVFGMFLFWVLFSSLWAEDRFIPFSFFCVFALGYGLFWGMQRGEISFRKTAEVFAFSIFLQAILGIFQFLSQEGIRGISILGISLHLPWEAGTSVLKTESGRWLRAYGGMPHPNIFGGALSVGLVLIFWRWVESKTQAQNAFFAFLMFVCGLALIMTFSRSSWLGLSIGLIFLGFWFFTKRRERAKKVIGYIFLFCLGMTVFVWTLRENVFSRFNEETILLEGSVRDRADLANQALSLWGDHPLLGVGAGNESLAAMRNDILREESRSGLVSVWAYQPAHSVFLLILSELGVVGAGIVLCGSVFAVRCMFGFWKTQEARRAAFTAAIVSLVPIAFLDHWLWTSHFGILLVFFLFGSLFGQNSFGMKENGNT